MEKGRKTKQSVGFALLKITTEQFAIVESVYSESAEVQLNAGVDFGVNENHSVVSCTVSFEFKVDRSPFIIIRVCCDFSVLGEFLNSFRCAEDNTLFLPKGLASHLAVLTIGTARGVLHAKTENKKFNDFIIPTIDVTDMIKEDIRLELQES